ncbi:LuxR C-terminal-related transcriptional regulator [Saccharopolyspora flava]|uniref:PAS domain S-box-containing protein n=1 Tax=Saccharopolyspora flava TaxID=95161 RepID=A0A1I6RM61_9PSEU|nr:LuxR C-terminal-related transcriptional regulator [Saccharopolyspora flava]SFS65690.1 PAS domain S-box-containing protein [Saccharopolyspora flava]
MPPVAADSRLLDNACGDELKNDIADADVFQSLLERSGLHLASLDLQLRITQANDAFVDQFGRSRESVVGRNFCELLHPGVREPISRNFERLLDGRSQRFSECFVGVGADQTAFTGDITGVAVRGASSGELTQFVVLLSPEKLNKANVVVADRKRVLSELNARILEGIATGESTVRLASRLFLSRQGVEYHVGAMLKKLKAPNRAALVSRAYSLGLLSVGSWPPRVPRDYVK